MTDGQKIALGLNPNLSDTDNDGASDYNEVNTYFTNPLNPDSDNDGMLDGAEIQAHTYPDLADTDGDGLTDKQEIDLGTNPLLADTDGDGIDDYYEHSITNWSPLSASNASQDDDNDGLSNLQEYQWCYSPIYSNTHDYVQRLIVVPPGINGIRTIADSSHYKMLAPGSWNQQARIWVRPLGAGTNTLPQRLYHNQIPGFYINGVEAPSVSSPIEIPAVKTNIEFRITSSSTAWGTNIVFRLTKTNDEQGLYCQANVYSPKVTATSFFTSSSNSTNVNFGTTGTLYCCELDASNKPNVFLYPSQSPSQGYGIPFYTWTDWCLIDVSGSGYSYLTNTVNSHDYRSVYGYPYNSRKTTGITFDPGEYCVNVGFDMSGNGVLDGDEIQESCKIVVVKVDIKGDYNRDGNPVDDPHETNTVTFAGPKGFVIRANNNDDNGDGEPDCNQNGSPAQYRINGAGDLSDIYELHVAKLGIPSNAIPSGMSVEIKVLDATSQTTSQNAIIFPKREDGTMGGTSLIFSNTSTVATYFGGTGDTVLGIEGRAPGTEVIVRLTVKFNGNIIGTDEIHVLVAPWMALSIDRPSPKIYSGFGDDAAFTADMNALFGSANVSWDNYPSWRQDEGEFGYTRTGVGQTAYAARSVILDLYSASDDFKALISSSKGWDDSIRSTICKGGGIEVSLPDAGHPYGRLILSDEYGGTQGSAFFQCQKVQWPPIYLPVAWLYVGHVDEVMSVVPSGASSVICVGDLTEAIAILKDYTSYPTNEIESSLYLSRSNLVSIYTNPANATAVATIQGYLDSAATNLAMQLGVPIIRIPVTYTLAYTGSGNCKTFLPNSVNAAVANVGGTVKVGSPDPRFYPLRAVIESRLGFLGSNRAWINCDTPHSLFGEAHCASNPDKDPPAGP